MSYHGTSYSTSTQSTTSNQSQTAPPGFHYMPDGSLMADAAMPSSSLIADATMLGASPPSFDTTNTIKSFDLDLGNIKASGETRHFTISGTKNAMFSLEIKNGTTYYNFQTKLFQATQTRLNNIVIERGLYVNDITFPAVAAGVQYDILLIAEQTTNHAEYEEVRLDDNSVDINSSTGSRSKVLQKVIYQTLDTTITLSNNSPTSVITSIVNTTDTIEGSRSKGVAKTSFEIKATFAAGGISIDRQPTESDVTAFVTRTIGAAPINIPGEDIYPAVSNTDTVDGAVASGTRYVMDTNVADKMAADDRITIAVTTDTIDGSSIFLNGGKIVMDNNVAGKMNVGDAITGHPELDELSVVGNPFTVKALDPDGDNAKEFKIGGGPIMEDTVFQIDKITDETTLTFSSILNREVITVVALNPDTDNVKEFSSSAAFAIRDGATLSFSNQRNRRWPIDNIDRLEEGMTTTVGSVFLTGTTPTIQEYLEETIGNEGEENEVRIEKVRVKPLDAFGIKPVYTRDGTTKVLTRTVGSGATPTNITFSEQALLALSGTAVKIFTYGPDEINRLTDYDLEFSDLKAELNTITTTTSAAVSASTTIPVASKVGIAVPTTQTVDGAITANRNVVLDSVDGLIIGQSLYVGTGLVGTPTITAINETAKKITLSTEQTFADGITLTFPNSIISGIGIASGGVAPYVASIASLNLTASAAQTLEDDQTFTFTGTGNVVTITGKVAVNNVGNEDITLSFDLDKFLTRHSN